MTLWGSVGLIIHVLEEIVKRQFVIFYRNHTMRENMGQKGKYL